MASAMAKGARIKTPGTPKARPAGVAKPDAMAASRAFFVSARQRRRGLVRRKAMAFCAPGTARPAWGVLPLAGCFLDCDRFVVKRFAIDKFSAHAAKPPCGCGFRDGTQLIIPASTCTSGQKDGRGQGQVLSRFPVAWPGQDGGRRCLGTGLPSAVGVCGQTFGKGRGAGIDCPRSFLASTPCLSGQVPLQSVFLRFSRRLSAIGPGFAAAGNANAPLTPLRA